MKSIYNKDGANKLQHCITAIQKQLSLNFQQSAAKTKDGLLGECALEFLTSPLFSAILGAGVWDIVNMAQQALTTWDEETPLKQPLTPRCSFNTNARARLESWLATLTHEWTDMQETYATNSILILQYN